jgi:hypothetical protein
MEEFGELTGTLIIILFWLEAFRFVLKLVFKKYGRWIKENTKYHPVLLKTMNLNKLIHPWIGYLIVVLMVIHAYIQTYGFAYFSSTAQIGIVAAFLMSGEVFIGFAGTYLMKKPRPKYWIWLHRLTPILVIAAILIHTQFD